MGICSFPRWGMIRKAYVLQRASLYSFHWKLIFVLFLFKFRGISVWLRLMISNIGSEHGLVPPCTSYCLTLCWRDLWGHMTSVSHNAVSNNRFYHSSRGVSKIHHSHLNFDNLSEIERWSKHPNKLITFRSHATSQYAVQSVSKLSDNSCNAKYT